MSSETKLQTPLTNILRQIQMVTVSPDEIGQEMPAASGSFGMTFVERIRPFFALPSSILHIDSTHQFDTHISKSKTLYYGNRGYTDSGGLDAFLGAKTVKIPTVKFGAPLYEETKKKYLREVSQKRLAGDSIGWKVREALYLDLLKQLKKFGSYVKGKERVTYVSFVEVSDKLIDLGALRGQISLTESPSLFFTMSYPDGYTLRFELFLDSKNAAYSLYRYKDLNSRNHGDLASMIKEVSSNMKPRLGLTDAVAPVSSSFTYLAD